MEKEVSSEEGTEGFMEISRKKIKKLKKTIMKNKQLKFAVPTVNNELTMHFGHCEQFAIIDAENNQLIAEEYITPPVHQPGVYPRFLADQGVNVIIAGGMGQKALSLFAQNNIEVFMGVQAGTPRQLVENYLNNQLETGKNLCDH